ncbi:MAG: (Fe-S)-binding protein [Promethearchaeota archaeon]
MASLDVKEKVRNTLNRAREYAYYCFSCGRCQIVCPTSILGLFSPKGFIHRFVIEGSYDLDGFIKKQKLFNCLTCSQCTIYCPMATEKEGVKFPDIVQALREYGFVNNLLDDELGLNSTHDELMQRVPLIQSKNEGSVNKIDKIKNDSSLKISEEGDIAYFIGCTSHLGDIFYQFNIPYEDSPFSAIRLLNNLGIEPVVLETKCCGHDNYWIGDIETAISLAKYNVELYKKAGVKTIICECAEGYRMWKYDYRKLVEDYDFEVKHLAEILVEKGFGISNDAGINIDNGSINGNNKDILVTYHDPCRLGRLGGHIYEEPRALIKNIPGVKLIEMKHIKDDSNCCGVSAFRACNSDTKRLRENRINEALATGAEYLITTCPKCITHFSCFLNEVDDEGNEKPEKSKIKVIDLASFISKYALKDKESNKL